MKKYDVETFCSDLKAILVSNFNTKLAEIDTLKGDFTLKTLDSTNGYFFQELNGRSTNYNPFLLYSIEGLSSTGEGPMTSVEPSVSFVIVLTDDGNDAEGIANRMLRYQRALKECFEEHWTDNQWGVKIKISSMVPVQFSLLNSPNPFRAIGVTVNGSIG